ncbi:MAG: hypothetical protein Q9201_002439 [Fulgogasparrea decipioides]
MPPSYIYPSDEDTPIHPPHPDNDALLCMRGRDMYPHRYDWNLPPQPQHGDFDSDLDNAPESETSSQRYTSLEALDDIDVPYLDLQDRNNNSEADSLSVSLKDGDAMKGGEEAHLLPNLWRLLALEDDEEAMERDGTHLLPNLWRLLASDSGYDADADAERDTSVATRYRYRHRQALRDSWSRSAFHSEWPDFVGEAYDDGEWIHDNVLDREEDEEEEEEEGKVDVLSNGARRGLMRFFKGEVELDREDERYKRANRDRVERWLERVFTGALNGQLGRV